MNARIEEQTATRSDASTCWIADPAAGTGAFLAEDPAAKYYTPQHVLDYIAANDPYQNPPFG